jgi:hypothetical protein
LIPVKAFIKPDHHMLEAMALQRKCEIPSVRQTQRLVELSVLNTRVKLTYSKQRATTGTLQHLEGVFYDLGKSDVSPRSRWGDGEVQMKEIADDLPRIDVLFQSEFMGDMSESRT